MNKVVFLDRDGTINKEVNYLYKKEELIFIPKTVEAIKIFHELGYKIIVVTNQAGVARGYYKEKDVEILHEYIDKLLIAEGTYIDAYYYCPHHPDGIVERYKKKCNCRKPNHGMIDQAVKDFDINLGESIIVGDKEIDVTTGKNAGIGKCVLVRSGHMVDEVNTVADSIYDSLYDFAQRLASGSFLLRKAPGGERT
ncbi:MAG: D-glycero-beta-D-manno-heptose 1,7-bisphosphate 7-phosphatase [Clostridiales bacterium]|nr:D-glycero-beta-D-manno-heptose 1,7-bisphosphate 7-phosphatase [Clostridiales bacterium]